MRVGQPVLNQSQITIFIGTVDFVADHWVANGSKMDSDLVLAPKSYAWDADPPVLPDSNGKYPVPMPGVTKVL